MKFIDTGFEAPKDGLPADNGITRTCLQRSDATSVGVRGYWYSKRGAHDRKALPRPGSVDQQRPPAAPVLTNSCGANQMQDFFEVINTVKHARRSLGHLHQVLGRRHQWSGDYSPRLDRRLRDRRGWQSKLRAPSHRCRPDRDLVLAIVRA